MISCEFFFNESDDDIENNEVVERAIRRRGIRDKSNPLNMDESMYVYSFENILDNFMFRIFLIRRFINNFRLSKDAFSYLLNEISGILRPQIRLDAIPNVIKLATLLRFCAQGTYQNGVGNDFNVGLAQPTVSLVLKEMIDVVENFICPQWIKFNYTDEEKSQSKNCFYEKSGIPGIIGCIDGTHIRIIAPAKNIQHLYYNRKGFHSINAMVVCIFDLY